MYYLKKVKYIVTLIALSGFLLSAQAANIGNVTDFQQNSSSEFTFTTTGGDQTKVIFLKDDVFRLWVAPNGNFTDPANSNPERSSIIFKTDYSPPTITYIDSGNYYELISNKVKLRAYISPLTFELFTADGITQIFSETNSINLGSTSSQTLASSASENYYGGGQQNGSFAHKGTNVLIENGGWNEGERANPAPFLMSSKGYGLLRNTFAKGNYDLSGDTSVSLNHQENRFDTYYFYGPDFNQIIDLYTELTGRPTFLPIWGLELGDADCYNDDGVTDQVIAQVAKMYRLHDMPGGWILPNDGYGCGYTDLPSVVTGLKDEGFYTGLWTENGVDQIAWEVGTAGTRVQKLDVAWTGAGYQHALDANKLAWEGIYNNSDSRPFVWTVRGWAGTQRYAVAWTGDQYGTWDLIRWHIPTLIGSGMSGQAYATTDVDGIFGGSPETYTRDLQWKTFTPVLYVMNGWSTLRKSPWSYDEPYRSINRDYLKLKMRMTPYMYKYMKDASETGEPIVRGMIWDHPTDPNTWTDEYQYQYMLGDSLLIAPVFNSMAINNNVRTEPIYVPEGRYIDYWDGRYVDGKSVIENYPITLKKLPILVKAGAIIPMYPEMLFNDEKPKDPLTFDIYPYGNSTFTMYEDDGTTRQYKNGKYATQVITSSAGTTNTADIIIDVGASNGDFTGKLSTRTYEFEIHYPIKPLNVSNSSSNLTEYISKTALQNASSGWYYDMDDRRGVVFVKLLPQSTSSAAQIVLNIDKSQSLPEPEPYPVPEPTDKLNKASFVVSSNSPSQSELGLSNAFDGTVETIWHTAWTGDVPEYPHEVIIDLGDTYFINKFGYTPRADGGNGTIANYEIYVSHSSSDFGTPVASGSWGNNGDVKEVLFNTQGARYVKLVALSEVNGNPWASAAEFDVYQDLTVNSDLKRFVKLVATSSFNGDPWTSIAELNMLSDGSVISQAQWSLIAVDSVQEGSSNAGTNAFDGDSSTFWHTQWTPDSTPPPHEITIDLGADYNLSGFRYLPRQVGSNGRIIDYELYTSSDGVNWGASVASGAFSGGSEEKQVNFVENTPEPAVIISPEPNSTFDGSSMTFEWTNDGLADEYQFMVGTTMTGNDIYFSGIIDPSNDSVTVTDLPTDGSTVHVSVHTKIKGTWSKIDYSYTSFNSNTVSTYQYVRLVANSEINGGAWASVAELNVLSNDIAIDQSGWALHYVDSEETEVCDVAINAFDGDDATIWHTEWVNSVPSAPHEIQINLGASYDISGFSYLPRQIGVNGTIADYELYLSVDGINWGLPIVSGIFTGGSSVKNIMLP